MKSTNAVHKALSGLGTTPIKLRKLSVAKGMTQDLKRMFASTSKNSVDGSSDDMFEYTSGRWIYNESLRLQERHLKFNIQALKRVIATSVGSTVVTSLRKTAEGGFNRILQAACDDGRKVLARLPYPSTVPRHFAVASEVATLEYLRLNEIPVPRVYGWSSNTLNPVGAEYIIMEKLGGSSLTDIWFDLTTSERRKVIEQVVLLEQKLFSLKFEATGSIYFPHDLSDEDRSRSVPLHVKGHEFCIGPMAHYSWWHGERGSYNYDRGPWNSSKDIFRAVGERELQWTKRFARPRLHYDRLYREVHKYEKMLPQPHIDLLNQYLRLAECLGYPLDSPLNRAVLRHPDLQPSNIILSDSLDIVGLIDWQHATIVPLCLAAGMPAQFQNYGDPESDRFVPPARELPSNFDSLTPEEQESVKSQHIKRLAHFLYTALTMTINEEHYNAIFSGGVILHQRLYKFAGTPWEGDSITLEAELIKATDEWDDIVSSGATACEHPPIRFSDESVKRAMDLHREQQEMDVMLEQMRAALGVDVIGWVPNEGFESANALALEIKERMIEAAEPAERHEMEKNFPFDNFDEEGN